jgi:release factor glutamine methyltransferase
MVVHATKVAFMFLCCVKTIKDVFAIYRDGLSGLYGNQEIEALTLLVCEEISGLSKGSIKAFPEKEITIEQSAKIQNILVQLKTGQPIQYILGYAEFYNLKFYVNESVLIPRPETEELVEWVIDSWQSAVGNWQQPYQLLDIGTGSGGIAISLKKNLQQAQITAIDISTTALETANQNARLNEVEIAFINADILNIKSEIQKSKFKVIISNPPYVTLADKEKMHTNVTDFEPHTALFVPENNPLIFYKAIADFAVGNLANNGLLFFEINESYGPETVQLLIGKGFADVELRKDMSGRNRMVKATWFYNG